MYLLFTLEITRLKGSYIQLAATAASGRTTGPQTTLVQEKKSTFKIQSKISDERLPLLHDGKVKKSLSQAILSWGLSVLYII